MAVREFMLCVRLRDPAVGYGLARDVQFRGMTIKNGIQVLAICSNAKYMAKSISMVMLSSSARVVFWDRDAT